MKIRIIAVSSIKLVGKIVGKEVPFLVDTGTNHNFIDPVTAKRIGLRPVPFKSFDVTIADTDKLTRSLGCPGTKIAIQRFTTVADLLILPPCDSQVILATVWLEKLGSTQWDFQKQTLKFWDGDKEVEYEGVQAGEMDIIDGKTMKMLWQVKRLLYMVQHHRNVRAMKMKKIFQKTCK